MVDFGGVVILHVVVTGGKQSQLLVRLTWTGMDFDWSLTIIVQLGPKLNTKVALNHHPPPPETFQRALGIVRGYNLVCRLV